MADAKAMATIKSVLLSTAGATGDMLAQGLVHALQDQPEERHELQTALLKMVTQVLSSGRTTAQVEAEGSCQLKVKQAEADLESKKVAVAAATEALKSAQATVVAKKEGLAACRSQLSSEEEEQTKTKALDEEKGQELAELVKQKEEVVTLLSSMKEKGSGEAVSDYLRNNRAELPLVAALRSVLEKEAPERIGFDMIVLQHLEGFLTDKVAYWEKEIADVSAVKARIHAESLGAWAVKEVVGDNMKVASAELETAESRVVEMRSNLKEAEKAAHQSERILCDCTSELTMAGERVRQCAGALELLERLEAGQEMAQEVPQMATGDAVPMEVDVPKDAVMIDAEMSVPITA
jgi:hypothetical protein